MVGLYYNFKANKYKGNSYMEGLHSHNDSITGMCQGVNK